MENLNNNQRAFFELVKAGLWADTESTDLQSQGFTGSVDWKKVYQLSVEQSVQGLVLAGIEKTNTNRANHTNRVPQELLLQWIGEVQMIEQQNKAMNIFVAKLIDHLRSQDIYALLVKGQGIAQCYEKPLWRSSGDVDLLLSESNYERAKEFLTSLSTDVETEYTHFKHQGMTVDGWVVELHGTLHSRLSKRVDNEIDEVQKDVFYGGNVRSWDNGGTQVFLPSPDNDVIFVFTHILHHFFFEGIGLRQICDWCRLLWTYKDSLNHELLESRIRKMGLMSEWKAFAAFAVKWLGMPAEAMPLLDSSNVQEFKKFEKKADKICKFVLEVGNFGHNKLVQGSNGSRVQGYYWRKFKSFWGRLSDMLRHFQLFPKDSIVFFGGVLRSGLHAAMRGE